MHAVEFLDKLKCLNKCEELSRLQPEKGFQEFFSSKEEDNKEALRRKMEAARQLNPIGSGKIEFRTLSVAYRPQLGNALRNLSFNVHPGEKIGIVGRTGSGKSTLLLAFLRIVEPRLGTIFVDGKDYTKFDLSSLRANVTVILQDHFLFAGTVRAVYHILCRTLTHLTSTLTRLSKMHLTFVEFGKYYKVNRVYKL